MAYIYQQAADILAPSIIAQRRSKSIKSRIYEADEAAGKKGVLTLLVSETLKNRELLDQVLSACNERVDNFSGNQALVYVLLYELLIGRNQKISGGGALKRQLLQKESEFRKALEAIRPTLSPSVLTEPNVPRYCRINRLITNKNPIDILQELGFGGFQDEHVPDLLVLPPRVDLHDHILVTSGAVILQDKSSCFPVAALQQEMAERGLLGFDCIDCCSAPGNKTTQLAAALCGDARVFAFDKSPSRFALLSSRIEHAGAGSRVECINDNFLETDPSDSKFEKVRTLLLDPSCSGSGSHNVDRVFERDQIVEDDARVSKLAAFQTQALLHALSFPQAQLVSYSTCSVFHTENEAVVRSALDVYVGEWELVACLPSWSRRGVSNAENGLTRAQSELVARADFRLGDVTGGFFVALFSRARQSDTPRVPRTGFLKMLKTNESAKSNTQKTSENRKKATTSGKQADSARLVLNSSKNDRKAPQQELMREGSLYRKAVAKPLTRKKRRVC